MPLNEKKLLLNVSKHSKTALYRQIYQEIQKQTIAGELKEHEQLPGMREMARMLDVSTMVIDMALDLLIEDKICYRRPKKGTCVGSFVGQDSRSNLIVVYSRSEDLEFDSVMKPFLTGVGSAIHQENRTDMLYVSGGNIEERLRHIAADKNTKLLGVIIIYPDHLEQVCRLAEKFPAVKLVLLNFNYETFEMTPDNVFGVFNDEFCGGYSVGNYLLTQNCRRIGLIDYHVNNQNYQLRIEGFLKAHKDFGLRHDSDLAITTDIEDKVTSRGFKAMEKLLQQGRVDAVFCINDLLAAGAVEYLESISKRHEITVFGYDNLVPDISFSRNASTVAINTALMGKCAIKALLTPREYLCKQILIAPHLIVRHHHLDIKP